MYEVLFSFFFFICGMLCFNVACLLVHNGVGGGVVKIVCRLSCVAGLWNCMGKGYRVMLCGTLIRQC